MIWYKKKIGAKQNNKFLKGVFSNENTPVITKIVGENVINNGTLEDLLI